MPQTVCCLDFLIVLQFMDHTIKYLATTILIQLKEVLQNLFTTIEMVVEVDLILPLSMELLGLVNLE